MNIKRRALILFGAAALLGGACGRPSDAPTAPGPAPDTPPQSGTRLVRETLTGSISATTSPACSQTFRASVDASYFLGGTARCVEFTRRSTGAGIIKARLTWQDVRLDLDLVLNDGAGMNFRQSIAANRCCESFEFFANAGMDYIFIAYLRGVDAQFLANGGSYTGQFATAFTLDIERPE
jgi:hypothetical protein